MTTNESRMRRGAVGALAIGAVATAVGLAAAPAHGDAFVRLPGGTATGDGLTLTRTTESAQISPSLAANGLGRTAWVSGSVVLKAPGLKDAKAGPNNGVGSNGEATYPGTGGVSTDGAAATLSVGYIVGCQVNVGSMTVGATGTLNLLSAGAVSGSGSLSIPLTPGQVVFAQLDYKDIEKKGTYYFNWDRTQLNINNCAGYAQARSYAVVETTGSDHQKVNLYGKPFSIG